MHLQTAQQPQSSYTLLPVFLILVLISFPPDIIPFTTYCRAFVVSACPLCLGDVAPRSPIYHILFVF